MLYQIRYRTRLHLYYFYFFLGGGGGGERMRLFGGSGGRNIFYSLGQCLLGKNSIIQIVIDPCARAGTAPRRAEPRAAASAQIHGLALMLGAEGPTSLGTTPEQRSPLLAPMALRCHRAPADPIPPPEPGVLSDAGLARPAPARRDPRPARRFCLSAV